MRKTWKIVKVKYDGDLKIVKKETNHICSFIDTNPKLNETIYLTYRVFLKWFWKREGQLSEEDYDILTKRLDHDKLFTMEDLFLLKDKTK